MKSLRFVLGVFICFAAISCSSSAQDYEAFVGEWLVVGEVGDRLSDGDKDEIEGLRFLIDENRTVAVVARDGDGDNHAINSYENGVVKLRIKGSYVEIHQTSSSTLQLDWYRGEEISFSLALKRFGEPSVGATSSSASGAPSARDIAEAVEVWGEEGGKLPRSFINMEQWDSRERPVMQRTEMDRVKFIRIGEKQHVSFGVEFDFWPVQVHVKGTYHVERAFSDHQYLGFDSFNTEMEFFLRKDSYGNWVAKRLKDNLRDVD